MLALNWIKTALAGRWVWAAVVACLAIAGWQYWRAEDATAQKAKAETAKTTAETALATCSSTLATVRATLTAEREAADAERARSAIAAQEEARRQFDAGRAAAGLSRDCVHDRGRPAVTRSLRDVLGEGGK